MRNGARSTAASLTRSSRFADELFCRYCCHPTSLLETRLLEQMRFDSLSLVPYLAPGSFRALFCSGAACYEDAMTYSDHHLRAILERTRTIAVVGVSANPVRPSYFVARYLGLKGYRIIPVNPGLAGQTLLGETVYAGVADIPDDVDMVDIFRRSEAVPPIVDAALDRWPGLQTIWMQIGVEHGEAAAKAKARGVDVIQNRCPKIEYQRLFDELRMAGFVTGRVSSKI